MMIRSKLLLCLSLTAVVLASCQKDDPENDNGIGYLHGAYIVNEGAFGNSNGSISYFDTDSSIMINHVFEAVNGRPLGDVVQSIAIEGSKGYIVVNNSQKVEIIDMKTFASIGTIDGLEYPRTFLPISSSKGYLTDGNYSGRVYVIDLALQKITDTIPCGSGPDKMIKYGNTVIVANSGGWGNDSTLTVIDTEKDKVSATWNVGMNPVDLVLDKYQDLWVLCKGKVVWNMDFTIGEETSSYLVSVNPATGVVEQSVEIGSIGDYYWPQQISINKSKDRIFYLEAEGIYAKSINKSSLSQLLIPKSLYGFGIDPVSDLIYALYAPSFTTSGWMYRYQSDGVVVDSMEVGIGPSRVVFN